MSFKGNIAVDTFLKITYVKFLEIFILNFQKQKTMYIAVIQNYLKQLLVKDKRIN